MSNEATAPSSAPIEAPVEVDALTAAENHSNGLSEAEADELEYQAAMKKLRAGKPLDAKEEQDEVVEEDKVVVEEEDEDAIGNKKEPKIKKFKVGKKEIEVDLSDDAAVESLIQKGIGAQETFQEASQMRKNAEAFVSALQKDPFKVLQHPSLKINLRELAENYLWDQMQQEKMTPEQRASKDKEEKLRAYEEAEQMRKQAEVEQRNATRLAKQREYWTGLISNSLDKHSLPKIPWTIEETAKRMKLALENGYKDVTPDDIVPAVKEDFLAMRKSLLEKMDGESLSNFLGRDLVSKINKNEIKRYKSAKFENKVAAPVQEERSGRQYRSMEEMQQAIKDKHR